MIGAEIRVGARAPKVKVALAGRHRVVVAVLVAALVVRAAAMVAYGPSLFLSDSWSYLRMAWAGDLVQFAPDRPNGYSLLIKILTPGGTLVPLVALQHAAGLAVALLVYVLARKGDVATWLAAAGAGLVALDAKAVAVHQHVMPEAFFTLALVSAAGLAIWRPRDVRALAAVGALLAGAILLRTAGIFVVPVFAAYLLWARAGGRGMLVATAVLVVPLVAYAALLQSKWGTFGLSANDGWFLYGRTAELARCDRLDLATTQDHVCRETAATGGASPSYLVWDPRSPASRAYPGRGLDPATQRRSNAELRDLARKTIRDRPGAYAGLVARDFGRLFVPGTTGPSDTAIALPLRPLDKPPAFDRSARDRLLPGYRPPARVPAAALHAYGSVVTMPRPLLAVALLVAVAALVRRTRHRREVFLLAGSGTALMLGSVATVEFVARYLVPAIPLLALAGMVAAFDLLRSTRSPLRATPARQHERCQRARRSRGRVWQDSHAYVPRPAATNLRTGVPQTVHGSPSRLWTRNSF